jgi:hypothetical protein
VRICVGVAALAAILSGAAQAGTLDHGTWSPSGCGEEPVAPAGLNLSSPAAFQESLKWVKAYEDRIGKYTDCMVGEANADHNAISDAVNGKEQQVKDFFDKANADSKRAQSVLGGKSGSGGGDRRGPGLGGTGPSQQSPD